jgi:hypothetical protein
MQKPDSILTMMSHMSILFFIISKKLRHHNDNSDYTLTKSTAKQQSNEISAHFFSQTFEKLAAFRGFFKEALTGGEIQGFG